MICEYRCKSVSKDKPAKAERLERGSRKEARSIGAGIKRYIKL
jgi:hypothetical protein